MDSSRDPPNGRGRLVQVDGTTPPPSTIHVFLAEGPPDGLWIVTKPNWTGIALRFSRNAYKGVRKREEFAKQGIYVLIGDPTEERPEIYVGEGKVRDRLNNHLNGYDFWTEAVVFVGIGDGLNVSHTKYLEAELLDRAAKAKRATLINSQWSVQHLGESEAADMNTFLREMLVVYPILGVSAFEMPKKQSKERLSLKGRDTDAVGQRTDEGFLVFAGATARKNMVKSADSYPKMVALRKELREQGVLEPTPSGGLLLTQDYVFSSPSLAAALLLGRTANGRKEWSDKQRKTLAELEAAEAGT